MAEHLTEDEQIQALKQWWKKNGLFTVVLVVACIAGYLGWQFWQNHQQQQAEAAAAIYNDLSAAVTVDPGKPLTDEKRKTANYLIDQLKTGHSHSFYSLSAAMYGAKIAVEANELDRAAELLQWALDHSDSSETKNVLRLRLARVMNALMDYDKALTHSQYDAVDDFTSLFAAVRGDAYLGKGDIPAAKAAYQLALDNSLPAQAQQQRLLRMKIADLSTSRSGAEELPAHNKVESSIEGKGVAPMIQSEQPATGDGKQSDTDGRGASE